MLYVGKAVVLRNRVRSYFQSMRGRDPKTRELMRHVTDFEFIRTDSATEALILENELIKRLQPKYNVMLKDSKTYPYLKITNEEWPRIISTRRIVQDGGRYFGPYTSAGSAYKALNLLNRLFPFRKCEKKITGHDEVCLYYHIKQCLAPCIGATSHDEYLQAIESAALFLNGRGDEILRPLEEEMQQAADAWNFERAAEVRDRIDAVKHVLQRQKVVSADNTNADVIAVAQGPGGRRRRAGQLPPQRQVARVRVLSDERAHRRRTVRAHRRVCCAVLRRSGPDPGTTRSAVPAAGWRRGGHPGMAAGTTWRQGRDRRTATRAKTRAGGNGRQIGDRQSRAEPGEVPFG